LNAYSPILADRAEELKVLDEEWASPRPSLVVVYGRRRIGKTFLVNSWVKLRRAKAVYIVVNYSDAKPALLDVEEQLADQLGIRPRLDSLRDLVGLLAHLYCSAKTVVVIDEFQRLAEAGLPQLLQEAWDNTMSGCGSGSLLVLLGSSVGAVERVALAGGAPLYGRATRILRLKPLTFTQAYPLLSRAEPENAFTLYAIFGGTPYYLTLVDPAADLRDNLERLVLSPGAPLLEEPRNILLMEVREPSRYLAVLEAASHGKVRLSDIASKTGIPVTSLPRYLAILESMDLICKVRIVGGQRSLYRVCDNFFRFWFRHIRPRLHLLERGHYSHVLDTVTAEAPHTVGEAWEWESLNHLLQQLTRTGRHVIEAGTYMHRGVEIDALIVTSEGEVYGLEAKWSKLSGREAAREAAKLQAKLEQTPWARRGYKLKPVLYARSIEGQPPRGVEVYTLDDIVRDARRTPAYRLS
jgi:AAA+ ATPase superfamily predicted ATPase